MEENKIFRITFERKYRGHVDMTLSDIKKVLNKEEFQDDNELIKYLEKFMNLDIRKPDGFCADIFDVINIDKDEAVDMYGNTNLELYDTSLYNVIKLVEE